VIEPDMLKRYPAPWWPDVVGWTAYDATGEMVKLSFCREGDLEFICRVVNAWVFARDDDAALKMVTTYFDGQAGLKRVQVSCRYLAWDFAESDDCPLPVLMVSCEPGSQDFRWCLERAIAKYAEIIKTPSIMDDVVMQGALIPWVWECDSFRLAHHKARARRGVNESPA
jgi:hypothetical protein